MGASLLKWPGGKRWLAPLLAKAIRPRLKSTYYEPFFGGGAIFFHLQPQQASLSDVNSELIDFLDAIRADAEAVVRAVWRFSNNRECYDRVRRMRPRSDVGRAARFLYLNRTCWGGIYRLNRQGEFNTPFGDSGRAICHREVVLECARILKVATIEVCDFASPMGHAGKGDVVYCDPPYSFAGSNGFIRYNSRLFGSLDHERLARTAQDAASRGADVVVSGLFTPELLRLYPGWWSISIERKSLVSRSPAGRRWVSEAALFSWRPVELERAGHTIYQ